MFLQNSSFFYNFYKNLNKSISEFNQLFDIDKIKITFEMAKKSTIQDISFLDPSIQSYIFKSNCQ